MKLNFNRIHQTLIKTVHSFIPNQIINKIATLKNNTNNLLQIFLKRNLLYQTIIPINNFMILLINLN